MDRRALPLTAIVILAVGCAAPVRPAGDARLSAEPARSVGAFSTGTTVSFGVEAAEAEGRVRLCGAWAVTGLTGSADLFLGRAVESGQVQLAGKTLMRDPRQFARLPDGAVLAGAPARCYLTEAPWEERFAEATPEVRFVRLVFDQDAEQIGGGEIIFRQLRGELAAFE